MDVMEKESRRIAVVGGGASGCLAAIAAARSGCTVFLLEKNEKLGKKLYATGNGRCNLTNYHLDESCYHSVSGETSPGRVLDLLDGFSRDDLIRFFKELGVPVHDRDGYVYPRTDQAETVALALGKEIRNLGIQVLTGAAVREIRRSSQESGKNRFQILFEKIDSSKVPAAASKDGRGKDSLFEKIGSAKTPAAASKDGRGKDSLFEKIDSSKVPAAASKDGRGKQRKKKKESAQTPSSAKRSAGSLETMDCDAVILCAGGLAGPSFGCSGDGYGLAESFSHHTTPLFPALTQLVCDCPWLKRAAGVRCHASVCLTDHSGQVISGTVEDGELQMTEYGVSGIPVFQISGRAAQITAGPKKIFVRINFLPEYTDDLFEQEIAFRLGESKDQMLSDLLLGLAHRKVIDFLLASEGLQAEMKARRLSDEEIAALIRKLRAFDLRVSGVRPFENAQVTGGGIPLSEITDRFESVSCPGLYLAGELLDVDGRCGGYNLQWAMSSGYQAGTAAASYVLVSKSADN